MHIYGAVEHLEAVPQYGEVILKSHYVAAFGGGKERRPSDRILKIIPAMCGRP
jgi:hypothetical protein